MRCVLPQPGGPYSTSAPGGHSGHRSIQPIGAALLSETRKSERPNAVRRGKSKVSCIITLQLRPAEDVGVPWIADNTATTSNLPQPEPGRLSRLLREQ